jgi:hypothetical protein
MEAKALCYILTFRKNGEDGVRRYIGHSSHFRNRLRAHLYSLTHNTHANKTLQQLYNDGWRYDEKPEIVPMPTKELAYQFEQDLIKAKRDDPEYVNIEYRNDTFTKNPWKEEIRITLTDHLKKWLADLSPDEKFSFYSKPGDLNGMFGKTHTEESRHKIREKLNAFYADNESSLKGKPKSEEHKAAISRIASLRVGELNPFYGRHHSTETKKKLAEANVGRIPTNARKVSIEKTVYSSLTEAGRLLGISTTVVLWRVNSTNPRFSGWKWF